MTQPIPIHRLQDWAANDLVVRHTTDEGSKAALESLEVHRDDSYFFLLTEKGTGALVVDFADIQLTAGEIYFLAPGQVHYNIQVHGEAWYVGVMPALLPKEYLQVFDACLLQQRPLALKEAAFLQCQQVTRLLSQQYNSNTADVFYKQVTYALLNSFLSLIAKPYAALTEGTVNLSRPAQLNNAFRSLLAGNFKTEKRPSYYAGQLHISEIYLNEAVKKISGFNVTYWILHEIMLEARRLLCHGHMTIKEIAYSLGYDDPNYFSRLFKQVTGATPLAFRAIYLK